MTAFCDWAAVVCFGIAAVISWFGPASAAGRWPFFVALGLLLWVLPIALSASHIAHS